MSIFRVAHGQNPSPFAGVENLIGSGMTVAELRAASPLQADAQRIVDQAVVSVGLQRLTLIADILAERLTYPITDPLSVMEVQWEQVSRHGGARRVMNPSDRGENHTAARRVKRVPVYLTLDGFSYGMRTLRAAERVGAPLDVSGIENATRMVNEGLEDAGINGGGISVTDDLGQQNTYGLLTAPNANTYDLTVDWTAANVVGTTGPAMLVDVQAMVAKAHADKKFGPFNLYVGTSASAVLDGDFNATRTQTIRQRLEQLVYGGRNLRIRTADLMPNAATGQQVALCQMTSDVVDIATGFGPTVFPWMSPDGWTSHWLVMAIMVPRFKDDYDGNSGVVIGSKA